MDQPKNLLLVGVSGSWAHGLYHAGYTDPDSGEAVPASDFDILGVYATPTSELLGLDDPAEWVNSRDADGRYDEVKRFMNLCLMGDSRLLELLATMRKGPVMPLGDPRDDTPVVPLIQNSNLMGLSSFWGQHLVVNQEKFHSMETVKSYAYYMDRQLQRMKSTQNRKSRPAMHLIRIALTGIRFLEEGVLDPDVKYMRPELHAIRTGEIPLEKVLTWYAELRAKFDKLAEESKLPEQPARAWARDTLLLIRRDF